MAINDQNRASDNKSAVRLSLGLGEQTYAFRLADSIDFVTKQSKTDWALPSGLSSRYFSLVPW
jgi:hypothetical protein